MEKRKVTIYTREASIVGNVRKIEASAVEYRIGSYAQHSNAVHVAFVPKGARRERAYVESRPSTVILDGWGHPEPGSAFRDISAPAEDVAVSVSRYGSCDPRWQSEFDRMLDAHVKATGVTVVADYRGHVVV